MSSFVSADLSRLRWPVLVLAASMGLLGSALRVSHLGFTLLSAVLLQLAFLACFAAAFKLTARFWVSVLAASGARAGVTSFSEGDVFSAFVTATVGMSLTVVLAAGVVLVASGVAKSRFRARQARDQLGHVLTVPSTSTALPAWDEWIGRLERATPAQAGALALAARESARAGVRGYVGESSSSPARSGVDVPPPGVVAAAALFLGLLVAEMYACGHLTGECWPTPVSVGVACALALFIPARKVGGWLLPLLLLGAAVLAALGAVHVTYLYLAPFVFACVLYVMMAWARYSLLASQEFFSKVAAVKDVADGSALSTVSGNWALLSALHTYVVPRLTVARADPSRFEELRADAVRVLRDAQAGTLSVSFLDTARMWGSLMQVRVRVSDEANVVLRVRPHLADAVQHGFAELLANAYRHAGAVLVHARVVLDSGEVVVTLEVVKARTPRTVESHAQGVGRVLLRASGSRVHAVSQFHVRCSWPVPDLLFLESRRSFAWSFRAAR